MNDRTSRTRRPQAGRRGERLGVPALCLLLALSSSFAGTAPRPESQTGPADALDAGVAVQWFDLLYRLIQNERLSPPVASRVIGYTGVALYEAVVPGLPDHQSLAGQLNALPPLPQPAAHRKHSWPVVANAALAGTLGGFFAGASADSRAAIDALEQQLASELRRNLPPPVQARSVELGDSIAGAVLAWASGDGFAGFNNCAFTPPAGPGLWVPTLPLFRPALQPCWGQLRPFVLTSGSECGATPHPAFSTTPGSDFYAEGNEVYATSSALTDEQRAIALFWADNAGETGTPPGHWISITGQIARQRHLSLGVAAEAYARVGIAVADGFISCWATKYVYNLLRPITYIQQNIAAAWLPLLATPAFPEYTSGHSVQSGAAATVLTDLFGALSITDGTHLSRGLAARSFSSFLDAAQEAAISRLYAGIHFRAAIERGVEQGQCIGGRIRDRVRFLKPMGRVIRFS